ncbi:hypothetical protein RJZ56_003752 [Blastomyces dermatitidis]|uniref:N-acetylgalactosaminide beta-1,3-galactosyltransferase n=2 Tax=Ajellomyces dermatitidis TaxID=5039 RepID=F2TFD2_AJEDA|nr:uncharacterized protein BDCG_00128 [Blastomyces dermatitidis ER-3]EEQ83323.1 hypothetical protein BDCG_00128 [Blastomyces dermatitidis ER-3]EGE81945.1 hypothetical protein BDDG_04888 [Blastomyces dermatitidis ATCC 18188]
MECRRYGYRPSRRWIYLATLVFSVLGGGYLFLRTHGATHYQELKLIAPFNFLFPSPPEHAECPSIRGLDDIHVILKTGATEALAKLPVHPNTTLRCIPHFTIFSDYEEEISGLHIYDVLRGVNDTMKNTRPEFKLYTSLQESGREVLSTWNVTDDESTPRGKPNNPGWVLDKWKFLPMMHETLQVRADANWYVFMEADTYIIWPNLLAWLRQFDADKPYYLGCPVQLYNNVFAHGGSGFVLSRAALKRVTEFHSTRVEEWDEFTAREWAGDYVLGKALMDGGIGLHWSWPMLQGSTPWSLDYMSKRYDNFPWCYPPVTYHHMTPDDIRAIWDFERNWRRGKNGNTLVLHRDVFQQLVQPGFRKREQDLDNESPDIVENVGNEKDCAQRCVDDVKCFQYSYEPGNCRTSKLAKVGVRKPGVVSGWMVERINQATKSLGSCEEIKWIRP